MRSFLRGLFGTVVAVAVASTTVRAQEDGWGALRQSMEAMRQAPAYRATVVEAGGAAPELSMEVVNPNLLHVRTGMGTEIYSDGKTMVSREGASGPFAPAHGNVAVTVALARQMATPDAILAMATGVRLTGHETVNGAAASVYAVDALVMGMRVNARVWVADADHRPLRTEAEINGELKTGGHGGSRRVHRNATVTYDYDPTIRIVLPTN